MSKHSILTETEFFKLINSSQKEEQLHSAYNEFVSHITELCHDVSELKILMVALMFTEIELQYHHKLRSESQGCETSVYINKALSFVQKIQSHLTTLSKSPIIDNLNIQSSNNINKLKWTGSLVELIEIIYAFDEIKCINDGESSINELTTFFGQLFGIEIKDSACYNAYTDMKRRKNDSRTYFLDKLSQRLNLRMQRDDEKERLRRYTCFAANCF